PERRGSAVRVPAGILPGAAGTRSATADRCRLRPLREFIGSRGCGPDAAEAWRQLQLRDQGRVSESLAVEPELHPLLRTERLGDQVRHRGARAFLQEFPWRPGLRLAVGPADLLNKIIIGDFIMKKTMLCAAIVTLMAGPAALAAVSSDEAAKLKSTLTPLGGERAANKE